MKKILMMMMVATFLFIGSYTESFAVAMCKTIVTEPGTYLGGNRETGISCTGTGSCYTTTYHHPCTNGGGGSGGGGKAMAIFVPSTSYGFTHLVSSNTTTNPETGVKLTTFVTESESFIVNSQAQIDAWLDQLNQE